MPPRAAGIHREMMNDDGSPAKFMEAPRRRMVARRSPVIAVPTESLSLRNTENILPQRREKRRDSFLRPDDSKRIRNHFRSSSSSSSSSSSQSYSSEEAEVSEPLPSTATEKFLAVDLVPFFGSISVSGRCREMEDAVSLQPDFCRPELSGRRPLHFFAVYDGHGGSHVATLCQEMMHVFLKEELMCVASRTGKGTITAAQNRSAEVSLEERWKAVMWRCFERMDEVALSSCACGGATTPCNCEQAGLTSDVVGSTAVVGLLTIDTILIANCGDSRAVLSRGGRAFPLSTDHKPDRPDELARIEAAGGRVIYLRGARVLGILAMSRALGDKYLKPMVISEPELTITRRTSEDECLILASDGLWDVLSNDLACEVARRCLREEGSSSTTAGVHNVEASEEDNKTEQMNQSRCSLAAALLTRLALGRRSSDNISVIVIDLKRG